MIPHHKYVINLHVRIDNVTEYVLCYWNSKDIPINSCSIYNYCNKPFTCVGLNFVIWSKGGSRDCDICLAQGILICSDCQGKFFCSDFCGIFHKHPFRKNHQPAPVYDRLISIDEERWWFTPSIKQVGGAYHGNRNEMETGNRAGNRTGKVTS